MESLIWTLIARSLLALLLAALGAASARWTRRPGMTYCVCALAIAVLLAPPLVDLPLLPAATADAAPLLTAPAGALFMTATTATTATIPALSAAGDDLSIDRWLLGLWAAGILGSFSLGLWRIRRFSNALRDRRPAPAAVQSASNRLGREIGLRRPPRVWLTETAVTPLLRQRGRTLEILFPSELLQRLTRDERDTLLTHELSHARRRDHWMRLLEFVGTTVFWWHPAVWWARGQLRRAEEQLCDRRVLAHLPHLRAAYARGLFKTAEFLAGSDRRIPALASGAGEARFLKERLMTIVERRKSHPLTTVQRVLLGLLASGMLIFLPTWAEPAAEDAQSRADVSSETGQRVLEIERQTRELEMQLAILRAEQQALQGGDRRSHSERAAELAEREAARALEVQIELEQRRAEMDRALALRELEIERHRREALRDDLGRARVFKEQAAARMQALESMEQAKQELERALADRMEAPTADRGQREWASTLAEIEQLRRLVAELKMKLAQAESGGR